MRWPWPRTTPPSSRPRMHAPHSGHAMHAAVRSPPPAWRVWRRTIRTQPNASSRNWPRCWAWTRPSAARCCTRSRCGRWPPTCPIRRGGWPRCRQPATTSACTSGARARRWRVPTGSRRWMQSARCPPPSARIRAGAGSRGGCWRRPAKRPKRRRCSAPPPLRRPSTASWPPTACSCPTHCARGTPTIRRRCAGKWPATRPCSVRWPCTGSTSPAGRCASGTMH